MKSRSLIMIKYGILSSFLALLKKVEQNEFVTRLFCIVTRFFAILFLKVEKVEKVEKIELLKHV